MRLRFWRKGELAVFDPAAGEMPEHLEAYPPDKPLPWRRVLVGGALGGAVAGVVRPVHLLLELLRSNV